MRGAWILLTLFAAACSAETDSLSSRDGGVAPVDPERDGGVAVVRDGGSPRDGGVVDAAPARRLVEFSLLGDSPPDNLVMNPNLTSLSTVGPFSNGSQSATRHFAETPTRQPAFELAGNDQAVVFIQAEPGMTTASAWIGWRGDTTGQVEALIFALARTQLDAFAQLVPVGESTKLGDITWQRFEGETTLELVGNNFFLFQNPTAVPLFITGPTVIARQGRVIGGVAKPRLEVSAATRAHAESLLTKYREALFDDMKPVAPIRRQASGSSER